MKSLKKHGLLLKIVTSVIIMGVFLARMDWDVLRNVTHHLKTSSWLYAMLFMAVQIAALAYRWMLLVNNGRESISYPASLRITLLSLLANLLLITSIGGIFVRVALVLQQGVGLMKAVWAAIVDRIMTLMTLVMLGAVFLPALGKHMEDDLYQTICMSIGGLMLSLFVLLPLALQFVDKETLRSNRAFISSLRYLKMLMRDQTLLGKALVASLIGQISYFAAVHLIAVSTGVEFSLLDLMTVLPVIAVVASLPIGFGGWGIREGAFVYGLGLIGIPMETAFLVSVQIGLISTLVTLAAGIPAFLHDPSVGSLRHPRQILVRLKN